MYRGQRYCIIIYGSGNVYIHSGRGTVSRTQIIQTNALSHYTAPEYYFTRLPLIASRRKSQVKSFFAELNIVLFLVYLPDVGLLFMRLLPDTIYLVGNPLLERLIFALVIGRKELQNINMSTKLKNPCFMSRDPIPLAK